MANDFKTVLSVNNKQYLAGLQEAESSVKEFQKKNETAGGSLKKLESFAGSAASSIGKFAGGLGIAFGAMETFEKIIGSSKATQDGFNTAMGTAEETTNRFFRALTSGDWSVFDKGILNAISNAKEYMKTVTDMQRIFEAMQSRYDKIEAEKTRLESIVENEGLTLKERKEAYEQMDTFLTESMSEFNRKIDIAKGKLKTSISGITGGTDFMDTDKFKDLETVLLDLRDPTSSLAKDLEAYKKAKDDATVKVNWNVFKETGDEAYARTKKAARQFYATYTKEEQEKNNQLLRLQNSLNDKMFQQWKELIDEISSYSEKVATWQKDLSGARDEITGATDKASSGSGKKEMEQALIGSIDNLEKLLAIWRDKFNKATTDSARTAANKMAKELEGRIIKMKIQYEVSYKYGDAGDTKPMKPGDNPGVNVAPAQPPQYEETNKQVQKFKDDIYAGAKDKVSSDLVQALDSVISRVSMINTLMGEGAAKWISWSLSIVQAIAQAIPQLQSLSNAQSKVAVTGAAASSVSMGPLGWLSVGVAVASVVAAMMSAPKFATGGIVPGINYSGDRVPIMANSGEMILNRAQQGRLFQILNGGGSKSSDVRIAGDFRLQGSDLVASIRNTENIRKRMR